MEIYSGNYVGCDECGRNDNPPYVEFELDEDGRAGGYQLCEDCIRKALELIAGTLRS